MPFLMTAVIFIGLALAVALAGMKLYVRPKEAMERVAGGSQSADQMPSHPSLAMHDLIKKLGNIIPQSPKDVTVMQRRMIRAGNSPASICDARADKRTVAERLCFHGWFSQAVKIPVARACRSADFDAGST